MVSDKKSDDASGSGGSVIDGLPIVTRITDIKLDGSNFFAWSKTIRIYLHSIRKASHLKDNPATDETNDQWLQNDDRLFLMIRNSIKPYVIRLLDHCEYVKELIDYLDFLYSGQKNISRIYSVCKAFHREEQQDLSLTAYFMEFKKMYEELNFLLPISADVKVMQKHREQIAVMSFLTGLRLEFDSLRCEFLNEYEIPSLKDTFSQVIRNETLESPHSLASNSGPVSRGGFQDGSRNGNSDLVADSQGFNSDVVECYYCHELGNSTRNCKKFLAKKSASHSKSCSPPIEKTTVTISFENKQISRLKGSER
ncbi:hypothetical protein Tco_0579440 [Tanacetum coccineum]